MTGTNSVSGTRPDWRRPAQKWRRKGSERVKLGESKVFFN